jgi:hypothetical protein
MRAGAITQQSLNERADALRIGLLCITLVRACKVRPRPRPRAPPATLMLPLAALTGCGREGHPAHRRCVCSVRRRSLCRASSAPLRDLLDAPTALAACCGFDLCHKYILYLYCICILPHHLRTPRNGRLERKSSSCGARDPLLYPHDHAKGACARLLNSVLARVGCARTTGTVCHGVWSSLAFASRERSCETVVAFEVSPS